MKKAILLSMLIRINAYADDLNMKTILVEHIDKMPKPTVQTKDATCTASAAAAFGNVGYDFWVTGYLGFTIVNKTDITQNYWIDEYMCVNGVGCTHVRNTAVVGAGKSSSGNGTLSDKEVVFTPGTYVDQASVQITGESTCFVQGSNYVTIK
jgi:hypothetical protein